MALTLSSLVIPTFTKGLNTLSHILAVAEEHARANNLDPDAEYPDARLIDDMRPLAFQVQNATRTVRVTLARLEGREDQPWQDDETTVADLKARVATALAVVRGADPAALDAAADRLVGL